MSPAAHELRLRSHAPPRRWLAPGTSIVGLIVHDVRDPYFAAIAAGAMRVAREDNRW